MLQLILKLSGENSVGSQNWSFDIDFVIFACFLCVADVFYGFAVVDRMLWMCFFF